MTEFSSWVNYTFKACVWIVVDEYITVDAKNVLYLFFFLISFYLGVVHFKSRKKKY